MINVILRKKANFKSQLHTIKIKMIMQFLLKITTIVTLKFHICYLRVCDNVP